MCTDDGVADQGKECPGGRGFGAWHSGFEYSPSHFLSVWSKGLNVPEPQFSHCKMGALAHASHRRPKFGSRARTGQMLKAKPAPAPPVGLHLLLLALEEQERLEGRRSVHPSDALCLPDANPQPPSPPRSPRSATTSGSRSRGCSPG